MANHSSTLAWKIPQMDKPGRPQSMGSQRVGHDWTTSLVPHPSYTWCPLGCLQSSFSSSKLVGNRGILLEPSSWSWNRNRPPFADGWRGMHFQDVILWRLPIAPCIALTILFRAFLVYIEFYLLLPWCPVNYSFSSSLDSFWSHFNWGYHSPLGIEWDYKGLFPFRANYWVVIAAMKLKDTYSLEGTLWPT